MIIQEVKQEFIEMRASGVTYEEISESLDVSRTTLHKWNKEFRNQIKETKDVLNKTLLEQFELAEKTKLELLTKKLNEIYLTIKNIAPETLNIRDLILIKELIEKDIGKIINIAESEEDCQVQIILNTK